MILTINILGPCQGYKQHAAFQGLPEPLPILGKGCVLGLPGLTKSPCRTEGVSPSKPGCGVTKVYWVLSAAGGEVLKRRGKWMTSWKW